MAQTGFTPIQLYSSSTTGNTPAAADLLNSSGGSELAINIFDGKLFYKDNAGAVQVIGWKIVPVSAGGTGQTSYTDGQLLIGNSTGNTLTKATLTAGSGVAITNGSGSITISATGGTGTVTSVSGTGTVSGISLSGTVTSSGSLTLGGTLDLSSPPTIGNTTANTITGTTITASTKFAGTNYDASSSAGGSLRTASGTACFQWAAGGGVNCTVDGSINMNGANAHINMSPTGTGHVSINPTGVGDINNVIIGATTPLAITGTTITATTFSGSGASLTSIPNSALVNSTISGVALGGSLFNLTAGTGVSFSTGTTYNGSAAITINATGTGGTVTSVAALTLGTTGTDLSSTVANSTTTPVITLNVPTASSVNRGALSAADWTTFNSKAPGVTFTTGYIPFGQGTTTLNQSANLTFDGTNLSVAGAVNKVTITSPATGSTLTIANGKTLTANNTLTLAGTDSTTMTFPTTSATIARTDAAQTFTGIQTFGTTASTGNYISVLGSDADNTYLVFSGARKYPRLDLADTVAGGSTFQFWNLGNQLRFGTNTGSATTASFYINSGNAGAAVFNGTLSAASFTPTSSTAPTNGMYLPAANTLSFSVNSTRTQTISATGVGIKSTSPQSSLDLGDSTSGFGLTWQGSGGAGGYGSVWTQYGAGNIWMGAGFISNTASNTFISTISTASTYRSGISLDGASNNGIRFFTDGAATIAKGSAYVPTERMRIFSTGGVSIGNTTDPGATNLSVTGTGKFGTTVGVGAATPSASGAGITFPATQSASTDANTLDDYEEGTWTPVISGSGTAGTGTYAAQVGTYTKIGNIVTVSAYVSITAHTGSGNILFTGLPFASEVRTNGYQSATVGYVSNLALTALNYLQGYIGSTSSSIALGQTPVGGGAFSAIPLDASFELMISASYRTA